MCEIKQKMDTMVAVLFVAILVIPIIWLCLSIKWRKEESKRLGRSQHGQASPIRQTAADNN
jgi:hypothetical protein